MNTSHSFTFSAIELAVRYGDCSKDEHQTISCYVHLGLERAKSHHCLTQVRAGHMRVINTLIETMCDSCLSHAWRKHCFNYIKRLMPLMHEMLDDTQYLEKYNEIRNLSQFFLEIPKVEDHLSAANKIQLPSLKK